MCFIISKSLLNLCRTKPSKIIGKEIVIAILLNKENQTEGHVVQSMSPRHWGVKTRIWDFQGTVGIILRRMAYLSSLDVLWVRINMVITGENSLGKPLVAFLTLEVVLSGLCKDFP